MLLGKSVRRGFCLLSCVLLLLVIPALSFGVSGFGAESQLEQWVPWVPLAETVELIHWRDAGASYVDVSIEFPSSGFSVEDWGVPIIVGSSVSADARIWRWTGVDLPVIITVRHTYSLGDLPNGKYGFTFWVWGFAVQSIGFSVGDVIIVPDHYPTIQDAISHANERDTVFVRNGAYYENVIVNKTISLIGECQEATIIDGGGMLTPIVRITAGNVTLKGFTVQNGGRIFGWEGGGIYITNSSWNTVADNTITNTQYGINLELSKENTIVDNSVIANDVGVHFLDYYSSGNIIIHNNFVDNGWQVRFLLTPPYNVWDNGYEGNYWSDYKDGHPNASSSMFGIWDMSYVIDAENQDRYPLSNQYWNIADVNHDLKVDIFDLVMMSACYCADWQDQMSHVDVAEPYGIINIFDVVTIASNYGKEWNGL